ncbi:carbamoyltransferase C-terminal domain-containing protein [Azospirillum doebereinerae]|uniref:Proline dehydrogenase n=1 Tax=Azospirillum doebereinerae TaxID=92933 RepID=A0A433JE59_9PROT|nr:carbamoyltransferase C-terminal domain-containing protein [Azospirillum doebereinerae]MCG5239324.1 3-hydroxymethylcephem carbamoyltransferase [Azospirillum doebereinerae]RUQ75192.1 proline dehydrogenase [Azospirillum doebereinerae]
MQILAMKPGHDGNFVLVEDRALVWQIEAEKDSFPRYETITADLLLRAGGHLDRVPDVFAVSGWVKGWHSVEPPVNGGYFGWKDDCAGLSPYRFMGRDSRLFTSTHERSHLFCSYGLSPFPQGEPCYALVWEGNLGCFYEIGADLTITRLGWPLVDPGNKYAQLFAIADPTFPSLKGHFRFSNAGKLMALAAFSRRGPLDEDGRRLIDTLLQADGLVRNMAKDEFSWSRYHDIGVTDPAFMELAGHFSDAIFDRFHDFARRTLTKRLPLVIGGGCGLNCEWNSRWLDSGLFADVFVPPCTNDTGSALGTAIEAQAHVTGHAKLESWSVYAGEAFVEDIPCPSDDFSEEPLDSEALAGFIADGGIVAWVQGRYEMGPRALGNRSILAEPFSERTRDRLNAIKKREGYRPIACICLEEEADRHFDCPRPSPYMLYFHKVRDPRLAAITHVDGSCRVQTVTPAGNPEIGRLLGAFARRTGSGVLCNTSLNFNGRGFINRMSDLAAYCASTGMDGFVVGDRFYRRRG